MQTRSFSTLALGAATLVVACAFVGCSASTEGDEESSTEDFVSGKPKLTLTADQRREMVSKKVTCPFVGTALAMKKLAVYGTLADPFAVIAGGAGSPAFAPAKAGSAVAAGGAGDLAQGFRIVARGNHSTSGSGTRAPEGMFSLDFPNSQGAHAAHSFILMGNPRKRDTGRLNEKNLGRLIGEKSAGGHAERLGDKLVVRRSELGQFVARNVACDPNAVSIARTPFGFVSLLGGDIADFTRSAGRLAIAKLSGNPSEAEKTKLLEDMLAIAVRNNLVGASGELGLLMTALEGSPNAVTLPDGERALAASDIEAMFAGKKVDGRYDPLTRTLPPNWDTTPKTLTQFLLNTLEILRIAGLENLADRYGTAGCPVTE